MPSSKQFCSGQNPASLFRYGWGLLGSCAIATVAALSTASPAQAQAAYGSYVGAGAGFGLTSGGGPNEGSDTAANIAVRYKLLRSPVSVRTQVLVGDSTAIVPTLSYDFPLSWNADAYIGAGASIVTNSSGEASPVGNETAVVIQPGVDYALPNSQFVVFGNAIIAFDAYKSGGTAVSIQGGVGLRF